MNIHKHFHTWSNMVGYMTENDDAFYAFSTKDAALTVLAENIERDWDAEYSNPDAETADDRLRIDARYSDAYHYVNLLSDEDYVIVLSPSGNSAIAYNILVCNDPECQNPDY